MIEIDVLPASTENKSGDSILIRMGTFSYENPKDNNQFVILIDSGYSDNAETIEKYLRNYYKTNIINFVFLTHPDADHISGFEKLLENKTIKIQKTFINDPWQYVNNVYKKTKDGRRTIHSIKNKFDDNLEKLSKILDYLGTKNECVFSGKSWSVSEKYIITVLGPSEKYYKDLLLEYPGMENERNVNSDTIYNDNKVDYKSDFQHFLTNPETSSKNDSSFIILISQKDGTPIVLFTGDAGVISIRKALSYAQNNRINVRNTWLMQLPHHGSIKNISEDIISSVSPKKVFVSAGENDQDHPSELLINYLLEDNIRVNEINSQNGIVYYYDSNLTRPGWVSASPAQVKQKVRKLKEDK